MNIHHKINYMEFPANDMAATKAFFSTVFQWTFTDYGPEYSAFNDAGLDGGFYQSKLRSTSSNGSILVVFYSNNLEYTRDLIEQSGGKIIKPIFDFPGGRRFHFSEPSGNEFAVWSDKGAKTNE